MKHVTVWKSSVVGVERSFLCCFCTSALVLFQINNYLLGVLQTLRFKLKNCVTNINC